MSTISVVYSNRSRGLRKKALGKSLTDTITTESPPPKKAYRKKWAELIQKIYEITPSLPKMSPRNENYRLIEKQEPIERILKHLCLWEPNAHAPPQNDKLLFKDDIIYDYSFFDSFAS